MKRGLTRVAMYALIAAIYFAGLFGSSALGMLVMDVARADMGGWGAFALAAAVTVACIVALSLAAWVLCRWWEEK